MPSKKPGSGSKPPDPSTSNTRNDPQAGASSRNASPAGAASVAVPRERTHFRQLLLGNPNYFGNLADSQSEAVLKIAGDVTFEELGCVGFNPNLNTLEATLRLKLPTGYSGHLCSPGSYEFVRFYVDYGAGWEDIGAVSVNVHDIPNTFDCAKHPDKPLAYVLSRQLDPKRRCCLTPVLPKVRAILSWNQEPPAGQPNWTPVWGNVKDVHIQIAPSRCRPIDWADYIGLDKAKLIEKLPQFEAIQDLPIPLPDPPPLTLEALARRYNFRAQADSAKGASQHAVEAHRFGFTHVQAALQSAAFSQTAFGAQASEFDKLGISVADIVGVITGGNFGNVTYEQLDCLGLDNNLDWLVATFRVKKTSGYSGGPCEAGSKEYVAFWADWDDTCHWTYLGTRSINVHDYKDLPPDGLRYSAVIPAQIDEHRRSCKEPKIARLRAVLSWGAPPSSTNPDQLPFWGNRVDTHVQIRPGERPSETQPEIRIIGGISVAQIDTGGNGMTVPGAVFQDGSGAADPYTVGSARPCPFGGSIKLQADIPQLFSSLGYKYRAVVQKLTPFVGPPMPVTDPFQTTDGINLPVTRHPDPITGYFPYLPPSQNFFKVLAAWSSSGDEMWQIRLEMVDAADNFLGSTQWYKVQLDNTSPDAEIHIDSGGDCKDFLVDDTVTGHFVARDPHFGTFSLDTLPNSMSPPDPTPTSGTTQTAPSPGDPWQLDTSTMTPCGYVIVLRVWDRTIVNSVSWQKNYNEKDVGFCLRKNS